MPFLDNDDAFLRRSGRQLGREMSTLAERGFKPHWPQPDASPLYVEAFADGWLEARTNQTTRNQ